MNTRRGMGDPCTVVREEGWERVVSHGGSGGVYKRGGAPDVFPSEPEYVRAVSAELGANGGECEWRTPAWFKWSGVSVQNGECRGWRRGGESEVPL